MPPLVLRGAMILVDTSIVIEFLRTEDSRIESLLHQHQAAICGVTIAEVLHGAQSEADREELLEYLALWSRDKHFLSIRAVLPELRLFEETAR